MYEFAYRTSNIWLEALRQQSTRRDETQRSILSPTSLNREERVFFNSNSNLIQMSLKKVETLGTTTDFQLYKNENGKLFLDSNQSYHYD